MSKKHFIAYEGEEYTIEWYFNDMNKRYIFTNVFKIPYSSPEKID